MTITDERLELSDSWNDILAVKDTLSIRQIAKKFGTTPGRVATAFKRTGTKRVPGKPGRRPNPRPDGSVAPSHKRKAAPVEKAPKPAKAPKAVKPAKAPKAVTSAAAPKAAPAPAPAPAAAKPTPRAAANVSQRAWRVTFADGKSGIVVAPSVSAAGQATAPLGDVVQVELIGAVLALG